MYLSASTRLNSSQSQGQTGGTFNRRFLARAPARPTLSTDGSLHLQQPVNSRHLTRTLNESTIFHDAKRQPGPYKAVKHRFPLSGFFCVKKKNFSSAPPSPVVAADDATLVVDDSPSETRVVSVDSTDYRIHHQGWRTRRFKQVANKPMPPSASFERLLSQRRSPATKKKKRRPMTKFKREAASHLLLFPSLAPRICTPRVRSGGRTGPRAVSFLTSESSADSHAYLGPASLCKGPDPAGGRCGIRGDSHH